jgi:HKD family nuclease
MSTFTNHKNFGGHFGKEITSSLKKYNSVEIASGYFGVSQIKLMWNELLGIAKKGHCKILIGMIYHEGVGKEQKRILMELNEELKKISSNNGIYIAVKQYHGKVYRFSSEKDEKIYFGSSNFSSSGFYTNHEFNMELTETQGKQNVINFLDFIFNEANDFALPLGKVELQLKGKKSKSTKKSSGGKGDLSDYEIKAKDFPTTKPLSSVKIKLRVDKQPNSSLNLYFDKGRKGPDGKYAPRPWYEVEITSEKLDRMQPDYPFGEFEIYAEENSRYYKIPMITASDGYKAITSKDERAILGQLIKGKLQRLKHLQKFERVTSETLSEYGNDTIELNKFSEKKYYFKF